MKPGEKQISSIEYALTVPRLYILLRGQVVSWHVTFSNLVSDVP